MEWFEESSFWAHVVILGVIIFLSLMFNLVYKRKTNPLFVGITQVVIPFILMGLMELLFFNWAFIALDFLIIVALYEIFNYSYFWYNSHRKFDEEKSVELNFDGQEPDRDPYCRVYFPRYQASGLSAYSHFEKNYDLIRRYSREGALGLVVDDFYRNMHPELNNILQDDSCPVVDSAIPPTDKAELKVWEKAEQKKAQQIEEWERKHFLKIMGYVLEGWYLHIVYFRWMWGVTPKGWEDRDFHANVKVYLLSVEPKLPPTLIINTVCFYDDETEDNRTFTCLFGIEGRRSEILLKRMTTLERHLVIFRFFQLATVIETLEQRVRYFEVREQNTATLFEDLANRQVVYDTRIQAAMPNEKRASFIERVKKQSDFEVT